jgi:hypothetical protein
LNQGRRKRNALFRALGLELDRPVDEQAAIVPWDGLAKLV